MAAKTRRRAVAEASGGGTGTAAPAPNVAARALHASAKGPGPTAVTCGPRATWNSCRQAFALRWRCCRAGILLRMADRRLITARQAAHQGRRAAPHAQQLSRGAHAPDGPSPAASAFPGRCRASSQAPERTPSQTLAPVPLQQCSSGGMASSLFRRLLSQPQSAAALLQACAPAPAGARPFQLVQLAALSASVSCRARHAEDGLYGFASRAVLAMPPPPPPLPVRHVRSPCTAANRICPLLHPVRRLLRLPPASCTARACWSGCRWWCRRHRHGSKSFSSGRR